MFENEINIISKKKDSKLWISKINVKSIKNGIFNL